MDDTTNFNLADTYVLDENAVKKTENMGMTGILRDLDDAEIDDLGETIALESSSGYTIELSLDDDD